MKGRSGLDETLHVLVATPAGTMGHGGIDRIMNTLRGELDSNRRSQIHVRFLSSRGSGPVWLSAFYMASFCLRMTVAHIGRRCDVVHINVSSYGSTYRKLIIARWARLIGIAYVVHLHGAQYDIFWNEDHSLLSGQIRAMFSHAASVIVLGKNWAEFVAKRAPGARGRITIVPNASPVPALPTLGGGEGVHIIFLGRLGVRKGVPQMIEALDRIRHIPGWRATLAGDGDIEDTRTRLTTIGLSDRVSIPGWIGPEDVEGLISSADILMLPSFAENLPVSVIEAMAAGLAVIATPVGAVSDIIFDNVNGLIVEPGDAAGLADALERLIAEPSLRHELGEKAKLFHRQRLHPQAFADALITCWRQASGRGRVKDRAQSGDAIDPKAKHRIE